MNANVDDFQTRLNRLIDIGISISSELDLDVLLEKVVHHARELTHADASTLYLLQEDVLVFRIVQNSSMGVFEGGTGKYISLPPVPLDKSNVSAYAAIERKPINIADVYASEEFDFTGPRKYDARTGYRTTSMLVVPMEDHEGQVIGVLQLINALDPQSGEITAFPDELVDLVRALASQAAVAISNAHLIEETKALFDSLIKVLAVAVDAKSRYTGNHVQRVAELTIWLGNAINEAREGKFKDFSFTRDEIEELRLAGWLHDVGKVTTPVWVMDKATKLETIVDRIETVKLRFDLLKHCHTIAALEEKLARLEESGASADVSDIDVRLAEELVQLDEDREFIASCNQPGEFMSDDRLQRLEEVARHTIPCETDGQRPCITPEEKYNLSVRKGSLTKEEMEIMRDHVVWSRRMLDEVPFKGPLKNVPVFAGQHHEKLDGKGYPLGLKGDEIPLQSRLIAVADFYEALSAKDRPYKKPMPEEKIIAILTSAAEHGEIDKDVLDLMIRDRVHERFEKDYEKRKHEQPRKATDGALEKA